MQISRVKTDADIAATFDVMSQLRPDLDGNQYVSQVRELMRSEGFALASLTDLGHVRAVAGFRVITMLYRGRILVIDDLVTDERERSRGYGAAMISWLRSEAKSLNCVEIQLISRVVRTAAHRFYYRHGFRVECLHLLTDV